MSNQLPSNLKIPFNLSHFKNKCSISSFSPQNRHSPFTAVFRCATCPSVAIAPYIILHCRSADRFSTGGLYRALHLSRIRKSGLNKSGHLEAFCFLRVLMACLYCDVVYFLLCRAFKGTKLRLPRG